MITRINTEVPFDTNKRILETLFKTQQWGHAYDNKTHLNINKADGGFAIVTYADDRSYTSNEILNVYASFIFDMVQKNTVIKFKHLQRYFWNWYSPSSKGTLFHQDDPRDDRYSIIYSLHTNDGGTCFKINDEIKFEKSVESQALLFPSKLEHRGIAPTKDLNRLNLNIIVQI
tara:strand:+ start:270 stop:788 length:519 start_codon:yes stop_codon:yes gene_type:complete